jgi:hypothetical protein
MLTLSQAVTTMVPSTEFFTQVELLDWIAKIIQGLNL